MVREYKMGKIWCDSGVNEGKFIFFEIKTSIFDGKGEKTCFFLSIMLLYIHYWAIKGAVFIFLHSLLVVNVGLFYDRGKKNFH